MVQINRSARLYQERRQPEIQPTARGPGPIINLPDNPAHHLKLEPPSLKPHCDQGPDSTQTRVWPYGDNYPPTATTS
jgi:hypothetical protein